MDVSKTFIIHERNVSNMKITITNFGPIKHFSYDLTKDIIVTFGDNNIGKSYAMQVVYLLLKSLTEIADYSYGYIRFGYTSQYKYTYGYHDTLKETIVKFSKSSDYTMDITKQINAAALDDISDKLINSFANSCEKTFGNFNGIFDQKPVIIMEIGKYSVKIAFAEEQPIQATIYTTPTYLKRATSDFHKSRNSKGKLDVYYYNDIDTPLSIMSDQINQAMMAFYNTVVKNIGSVYFLPASRSGIYSGMSAFSSIIAELSKNKAMLTRKIELPGISEPISDYFLKLSNIRGKENADFSEVYQEIEDKILHGRVRFNRSRNTLVYSPEGVDHEFEMTEVSSMVSEISPIVAFLKYIIAITPRRGKTPQPKPIVFIEEPEAHLHPKNQIKLINLFAKLHKYDIKIIVSSHSNYIFNKLNNLLLKGDLTPDIYSAILLRLEENGSESSFMGIDELGVDDTNFIDVTQELYNEREALIAAWNDNQG